MALFTTTFAATTIKLLLAAVKLAQTDKWEDRGKAFTDLLENGGKLTQSIADLGLTGLAADLQKTATEAEQAFAAEGTLEQRRDAQALFDQYVPGAIPAPDRLVALGLQPTLILAEIESAVLKNPQFTEAPLAHDLLTAILTPVLNRLLNDPAFTQKIEPALWRRVLDDLAKSRENTVEILMLVRELHATKQTTVHQDTIIAMARKIRPNVASREQALIELEAAVDLAAERQARGEAGSNVDEFVDAVLKELNRLTRQGELAQAASEADRAVAVYEDRIAREQAGFGMVLQAAIDQHKLNYDPEGVAKYLARQLTLETPDASQRFAELRAVQDEYYVRGRDKGINLDLAISIALARQSQCIAKTQDERGAALNDQAISLQTLGAREGSAERLAEAVAACRAALEELTQARVPLDWAMTQNNLGNALATLGEQEGSAERLAEAVAAYRAALEERTQARVPLDWAMTQNNLGAALQTLGEQEGSAERLAEAVTACRAALQEYTQARVPLDWAKTQFNLGGVELAYFTLTADPAHLDRAAAYAQAARAVFVEKAATHYITMADAQLARITAKRP